MAIITLLTDFGVQDEYVGVLKGAILSADPLAVIVDLCHAVGPQDARQAAWLLRASYCFFPEGSIHMCVVDPGVGTDRKIIAAQCRGHLFLAPDNGLLRPVLDDCATPVIHQVENRSLFRHPVSRTFHGRDIFAPVAAHLSRGLPIRQLGRTLEVKALNILDVTGNPKVSGDSIQGTVVSIDRFGNLITNIAERDIAAFGSVSVVIRLQDHRIVGLSETYAGHAASEPIAIIGSRKCLEIAMNCDSAADRLNVSKGASVLVSADR